MTHFALAIDPITNDLYKDATGNLATVKDAEAIGQHARQRLKTFEREWYLDTTVGVPWIDQIFKKPYDPVMAEAIVKEEVLDTDGVTGIKDFNISLDPVTRNLIMRKIKVATIYEEEVTLNG